LRHTVATTLLFNGCPIGHIKEILSHEHLMTTCKFYLGADKAGRQRCPSKVSQLRLARRETALAVQEGVETI
jgi:integrase